MTVHTYLVLLCNNDPVNPPATSQSNRRSSTCGSVSYSDSRSLICTRSGFFFHVNHASWSSQSLSVSSARTMSNSQKSRVKTSAISAFAILSTRRLVRTYGCGALEPRLTFCQCNCERRSRMAAARQAYRSCTGDHPATAKEQKSRVT